MFKPYCFTRRLTSLILSLVPLIFLLSYNNVYSQVQINGDNYGTLKAAFDALNNGDYTGDVTVLITGNTTESATALLWGDYFNSCMIRPSGGQRTISGNIDGNLVEIQSSNVTIDGSLTVGGTSKDLTITNGNSVQTYMPTSITFAIGQYCTLKNTNVYCQAKGVGYAIAMYYSDNILIENCNIYKADIGIFAQSFPGYETAGYPCTNITIRKCKIGSTNSSDKLRFRGIQFGRFLASQPLEQNVNGFTIEDNEILGLNNTDYANSCYGIGCTNGAINGTISRNKIHDIKCSYSTYGTYGMYLGWSISGVTTPTTGNITVDNNMIYDYYTSTGSVMGIVAGYIDNVKIYHNTIYGYGSGSTSGSFSACLFINPQASNVYCRNNIFKNTITGTGAYGELVIFANVYGSGSFAELDYNDYYVSGTGTVNIGWWGGTYSASLSAWQTTTSKEANGSNIDPTFVSSTDLHLDGGTITNSNFKAPSISGITKDIDGETRNTGTGRVTFMGADEVIPALNITQNINQLPGPICAGTPFTLTVGAGVTFGDNISRQYTIGWEWYKVPSSTPISGENLNAFTRNPSTAGDNGTYYAKAIFSGLTATSNQSTITIHSPAQISQPLDDFYYVCEGFPFDYPPTIFTQGTITVYQWQKQNPSTQMFENIAGQTGPALDMEFQDANQATGTYRVLVYGGVCDALPVTSNETEIVVSQPLTNVYMYWDEGFDPNFVCFGEEIRLYANASGTIAGYQWEKYDAGTFYPIQNNPTARTSTLVIPEANEGHAGVYRCVVYGSANCLTPLLITEEVTVAVYSLFEIIQQPESKILCQGESFQLEVVPGGEVFRYRWQKDGVDLDPAIYPSADEPILNIDNAKFDMSGTYRCMLNITDCRGNIDLPTDEVLVYVLTAPEITRQPMSQVAENGGTVTVEVQAHNYNTGRPIEKLIYQWYRGQNPLVDDQYIQGSQQSILSITNFQPSHYGTDYSCIVAGLCGSTQSEQFGFSVKPIIEITLDPQDGSICEFKNISMSVVAIKINGEIMDYQWYKDGVKLENSDRISGSTDPTMNIMNILTSDAGSYTVEVTVQPGNIKAISKPAILDVKEVPGIIQQPQSSLKAQVGARIDLTVVADGEPPLAYQWYKEGVELIGETNATLSIASATFSDAGMYRCKVTNECGDQFTIESNVSVTPNNVSSVGNDEAGKFYLMNAPNPFDGETVISYILPQTMQIRINLTDVYGREVALLLDNATQTGYNELKINSSNYNLPSGVYYYTLTANGKTATRQMVVLK